MIITNMNIILQGIANIELEGLKIPDSIKTMLFRTEIDTDKILKFLMEDNEMTQRQAGPSE